jgi:hypothetical protein
MVDRLYYAASAEMVDCCNRSYSANYVSASFTGIQFLDRGIAR